MSAPVCKDCATCHVCRWTDTHAWLCPIRAQQPYSDGKVLWGPACNCGAMPGPHRHGASS